MTGAARFGGAVGPVAAAFAAAASYAAVRPAGDEALGMLVVAAALLGAVVWALTDLERFVLVPLLAAMTFPATVLQAGGALVATADLLLVLALGAWLAYAALGTARPFRLEPIVLAGLGFAGVTAASIAWTSDASATAKAAVQMFEIVVVVPAVFASVPSSLGRIREGMLAYVAVTGVLAMVTTVMFGLRLAGGDFSPQYLVGLHKNAIGSFLGVGLVLAFALSLDRERPRALRRALGLVALVELAGLISSISRGALIGSFAAAIVVTLVLRRARLRTLVLGLALGAAFLVTVQAQLTEQAQRHGGYETTIVRQHSYANAVERIREEPLLGTGAGTYWDEIPELGIGLADPNNLFLLTWAELGLLGIAALLFLLARYVRLVTAARRLPDEARVVVAAAGGAALSLLVHFQFDSSWTRGTATICFALTGIAAAGVRLGTPAHAPGLVAGSETATRPLRVVHLVTSDIYAGIERHVVRLARGLAQSGVDCTIACPPGAERLRAEAAAADLRVIAARLPDVVRRLSEDPPDVVHVHDGVAAVAGWRIAAGGRSALVRTQHFVRPASVERGGWRRAASLALHRALNVDVGALVAVSESVAEAVRDRREVAGGKIVVISPGIELPGADDVAAAQARRNRRKIPRIAYVGRLEREKSPELLLKAMPLVLERVPQAKLVVAGSGSLEEELRSLSAELGLERTIEWAGEVADPAEVLGRVDVFVNPSAVEGFGLAVAEAMSWGLPVVGFGAGGVGETVVDGVTGLLVQDPAELADAIVRLASDRALARRLGRAAREQAVARFDAALTVERTAALYDRLRR